MHRGGRGQSFVYELLFERQATDGKPLLPGLIDVESCGAAATTERTSGRKGENVGVKSAPSRGDGGGVARGRRSQ